MTHPENNENPSLNEHPYLNSLMASLGDRASDKLHMCVQDLLANGLDITRFQPGEFPANRQDVTQFLAAWSRYAGLTEEESTAWLMDYCVSKLAVHSKRTPAAIRHSTKGNLRYIYRSNVPFICGCMKNPLRAHCTLECPVYAEMEVKFAEKAAELPRSMRPPTPIIPTPRVKEVNRAQFETAMNLIRDELEKGTKPRKILPLLEERGFKTRTGRKWTASHVSYAISQLRSAKYKASYQAGAQSHATSQSPPESSGSDSGTGPGPE